MRQENKFFNNLRTSSDGLRVNQLESVDVVVLCFLHTLLYKVSLL